MKEIRYAIKRIIPSKIYLKFKFRQAVGMSLNLKTPMTFNEKLQWLKLYDHNNAYTSLVDKYLVKQYVSNVIGEQYTIPTLGLWNSFDDIDFESLPRKFVLKCTHDSGSVIFCDNKDEFDKESAKMKLSKCLGRNFFYVAREWPYKNCTPRIIAEEYIETNHNKSMDDYKVLCFGGNPKLIEHFSGRFSENKTLDYYDTHWNKLDITQTMSGNPSEGISKPVLLEKMIELSNILAKNIPHVRIDWYIEDNKLYFGEYTFFDGAGFCKFDNIEHDYLLGSWITLPEKNGKK